MERLVRRHGDNPIDVQDVRRFLSRMAAPSSSRRQRFAFAALMFVISATAWAQAYSTTPMRIIVGAYPGSYPDSIARLLAKQFSATFDRPVVVVDRPGASGAIAMQAVARSKADGNTIGIATMSQLVFNPILYPNLQYDPIRDLTPIATLVTGPMLIAAHPDFDADSLPAVLDLARKKPGEIQVAVPGEGSPPRIVLEMLMKITGTRFSVVPFRGGPDALANVLNGEVPLLIDAPSISTPHIRSGKLKAIAVTGQTRISTLPEVPTVTESGYPDLRGGVWIGLVAPGGMPRAKVAHLHNELVKALAAPDLMRSIEASGARVMVTSSEEFSKMISEDRAYWTSLIEASGLRVQ